MTGQPASPMMMSFPSSRRVGRPRVSVEETTSVSTRLPLSDYNRLWKMAEQRRTTIAGVLRDIARRVP